MIHINKLPIRIQPSPARTLVRPFVPGSKEQVSHIMFRICSIRQPERRKLLDTIYERIGMPRHMLEKIFMRHFENIQCYVPSGTEPDEEMKYLMGAFFTQEYSLESTALSNPSIVLHPEQDKPGVTRFILSLRAIGEGHISSITFMEGEIDNAMNVTLQKSSPYIHEPQRYAHLYEKKLFMKTANELDILSELNRGIFDELAELFSFGELQQAMYKVRNANISVNKDELQSSLNKLYMLAQCNFTLKFSTDDLSERTIYPASPSQSNGVEDARFVRFTEDDGSVRYYATFTAYDGRTVMPEMLETADFREFRISTLNGPAARNKGMALFPRRVNGLYMMLGRQDNESLYIMKSDNPYFWYDYQPLIKPSYDWETIQIGNCGSPIEIEEGWLVMTHGVGAVRSYSLGFILLDKKEPWRVIGRMEKPLLEAVGKDRFGYVPNVLYTCGALALGRTLFLPYAIGDAITTFALINIDDLVREMKVDYKL